jgi:hypothetical protein
LNQKLAALVLFVLLSDLGERVCVVGVKLILILEFLLSRIGLRSFVGVNRLVLLLFRLGGQGRKEVVCERRSSATWFHLL